MAQNIILPSLSNTKPLVLIAGPCMIENEEMAFQVARHLHHVTSKRGIAFVFKASFDKANRQSLDSPRGVGIRQGLEILSRIKEAFHLPVLTDIHLPEQAKEVAQVADVLQIPAFLCRQTDLVVAAGETGRIVNIKKGQFLSPNQTEALRDKARRAGARDVWLTERGTTFGYNDLVVDFRSLEIMKSFSPVVFDASHSVQKPGAAGTTSGGDRQMIPALLRAAVAVGIAAVFLEVHPAPENALSDSHTQWPLESTEILLDDILPIDKIVKGRKHA
ncbi:MAG: 3-deoxy-8-phosphooctulonate synthase [Candidatus Hydrogenedentota bacterium]|nr:MAG: 3-deoxy-8-phosphooctulonate synthase [Candidatus Hydrogenedentota bacterium]